MTLIIIFGLGALVGTGLLVWQNKLDENPNYYGVWRYYIGWSLIICFAIALIFSLCSWIPSKKNSEIQYQQLLQEKQTIESMISTDRNVDRLLLNERVIDYNNRIISIRENSQRIIKRDYYSNEIDWRTLDPIEWR